MGAVSCVVFHSITSYAIDFTAPLEVIPREGRKELTALVLLSSRCVPTQLLQRYAMCVTDTFTSSPLEFNQP